MCHLPPALCNFFFWAHLSFTSRCLFSSSGLLLGSSAATRHVHCHRHFSSRLGRVIHFVSSSVLPGSLGVTYRFLSFLSHILPYFTSWHLGTFANSLHIYIYCLLCEHHIFFLFFISTQSHGENSTHKLLEKYTLTWNVKIKLPVQLNYIFTNK